MFDLTHFLAGADVHFAKARACVHVRDQRILEFQKGDGMAHTELEWAERPAELVR